MEIATNDNCNKRNCIDGPGNDFEAEMEKRGDVNEKSGHPEKDPGIFKNPSQC